MYRFALVGMVAGVMATGLALGQQGDVGLGVILGEPTGVSAKLWTSSRTALSGAGAWSFARHGGVHMHLDWVRHNFTMIKVEKGRLPFYYGVGGRVKLTDGDDALGARVPVGIDYLFGNAPLSFFVEVVPILDFAPSTQFNVNGGIGLRYMFR